MEESIRILFLWYTFSIRVQNRKSLENLLQVKWHGIREKGLLNENQALNRGDETLQLSHINETRYTHYTTFIICFNHSDSYKSLLSVRLNVYVNPLELSTEPD
jgi:hypothetical protein